jgi:hypothetical protein
MTKGERFKTFERDVGVQYDSSFEYLRQEINFLVEDSSKPAKDLVAYRTGG